MASTTFQSLLTHLATIERRRRTPDGQGGWVIDYVPVGTVAARIRPTSGAEREVALAEGRDVMHVLYACYGANIRRGDRVTVRGLVVEVEAVREPSLAGEHIEVDCLERQVEASAEEGS